MIYLIIALSLLVIAGAISLAFTSRMDGGGEPKTPEAVEKVLCLYPYSVLGFLINPIAGVLNWASWLGRATGHGQYFPDINPKAVSPEKLDFLLVPFFGKDPRTQNGYTPDSLTQVQRATLRKRNFVGMCLTGLLVTIVPAVTAFVFLGFASPIGYIMLLSGLMKGPAYEAGLRLGQPTVYSEYLNGLQQGFFAFLCIAILLYGYIMAV